jgi:hypothetical protein
MDSETFDRVYNKMRPFLSVEKADMSKTRPLRCVVVSGVQCALRWNPKGKVRPTAKEFAAAYNLVVK